MRALVAIVVAGALIGRPCEAASTQAPRASVARRSGARVGAAVQRLEGRLLRAAARVAPQKFAPLFADTGPIGPNRITEERPFIETKGAIFGVDVGLTVSELHQVRAKNGLELVHVVAPDGSSNLELVLGRKEIGRGQRLELQGPALNTSRRPGTLPVGVRFIGVGLTGDLVDAHSKEAVSYTLEAKLTERSLIEAGRVFGPALLGSAARAAGSQGAHLLAGALAGAVPVISTGLALTSARWAWRVVHDPASTRLEKGMAVAHASADAVRVVNPIIGTVANAGLVVASSSVAAVKIARTRRQLRVGAAGAGQGRHASRARSASDPASGPDAP